MSNLSNMFINVSVVLLFCAAYVLVIIEEYTGLRKSKVVIFAAGLIWALIAWHLQQIGYPHLAREIVNQSLMAYIELALFLLVGMIYVKTLQSCKLFFALGNWLLQKGLSLRQCYWLISLLTFLFSPIFGCLMVVLVMCAFVLAIAYDNAKFVNLCCVAIIVTANAAGVFSPLGDITTQMLWHHGILSYADLKQLLLPAVIASLIPVTVMSFFISGEARLPVKSVNIKYNAKYMVLLFVLTLITAFAFNYYLHLPAVIGMMVGLGYLMFFGYYLKITRQIHSIEHSGKRFDIFAKIRRIEWDTILFLYGGLLCLTGLATVAYLAIALRIGSNDFSSAFHVGYLPVVIAGFASALFGNIPVLHGLLTMKLTLSTEQWWLLALASGLGGSLLPLGSVAGIVLLGQARDQYTFMGHLKWFWLIVLGYWVSMAYCSW